ncbi:MAG: hypothetical protein RRY02_09855, partial [Muribaculaceae bacterium]
ELAEIVAKKICNIIGTKPRVTEMTRKNIVEEFNISYRTFDKWRKAYNLDINSAVKRNGTYYYNIEKVKRNAETKPIFFNSAK